MKKQLTIRVSQSDYDFLSLLAEQCELTKSKFVRLLIERFRDRTQFYL